MDFFCSQDTILWKKNASEGVFDKTVFVKFKISNKFKQNIDETHQNNQKSKGKNPYQPVDFKNLKKKIREPNPHRPASCKGARVSIACTVNNELLLNIMLCIVRNFDERASVEHWH